LGDLDVFPTIFSESITLQSEETVTGQLTAFNLSGQAVGSWKVNGGTQSFSVGQMPAGTYIFAFETKEGVYTRMAIKEQ